MPEHHFKQLQEPGSRLRGMTILFRGEFGLFGGFATRYGSLPLMLESSFQILGLNPFGSPDFNFESLNPLMPRSSSTLPTPWPGSVIPLVVKSQ
jgi:hypothetical protein